MYPTLTLSNAYATATVSLYGGQVMGFTPHSGTDLFWATTPDRLQAAHANTKPLRGGIPVCWPWFRNHPADPAQPSHGLARLSLWEVEETTNTPALSRAVLALRTDESTPGFPHKAKATLTVTLTNGLDVALTTANTGAKPITISQALHTYLRVSDVANARLEGLAGVPRQHISSATVQPPLEGDLAVEAEVEHMFSPATGKLLLHDTGLARTIEIENYGGTETVVWNPWAEKAKGLDMPADGYKTMLCVEAANAELGPVRGALTLKPEASHTLGQRFRLTA